MAIPVLDEPVRRVFCVPLIFVPTLRTSSEWAYSTGGVVIPRPVLVQRNDRVLAYFGGTIYAVDANAVGEARLCVYAADAQMHTPVEPLTIRSEGKDRQTYLRGPYDITDMLPGGALVGVRAAARSVTDGTQVSFFHLTATFLVQ